MSSDLHNSMEWIAISSDIELATVIKCNDYEFSYNTYDNIMYNVHPRA